MRRKLLAFALATLLIGICCATSAPAQADKEAQRAGKVQREVEKIGIEEEVEVKLQDGAKVRGRIRVIGDKQFVVTDKKGAATSIPYSSARKVIKGEYSTRSQLKLLGLAVSLLAGMTALIVIVGRKDSVTR